MARIPKPKDQRERTKATPPPRRRPVLPGWVPLFLAAVGFGLALAPDDVTWLMRVAGAAMLAAGSYWLGTIAAHDPADTSRIQQLEAALLRMGLLDRDISLRRDIAQALGTQRGRPAAPPAEPRADVPDDLGQPGAHHLRSLDTAPEPDLDAPLPGEPR